MSERQPSVIYLKDYTISDHVIDEVFLAIDLFDDYTMVTSTLRMRPNPALTQGPSTRLHLHGEELSLQSIVLNGKTLQPGAFVADVDGLTIHQVPIEPFTLETTVMIHPDKNTHLSGLYRSRGNYCTQCEPHGFRRITYFIDRPDVMSRFTVAISADQVRYPYLLSNGNLIETKALQNGRHWVKWQDPSLKPCYLFALVAGDFDYLEDKFLTAGGRAVLMKLYLEKGYLHQGHYALACIREAMRWDEEAFGREYDLDIFMVVAVSDFNMGAMENKGLNIFNTKYILANSATATDQDYMGIEKVIGHEYFHNWSGNRITCRDWFQITLKEGFTVFRDQLFSEDLVSRGLERINAVNVMRNVQFIQDAGPLAHPIQPQSYIEINNFYTVTVYNKGAEIIRMMRTLIGEKQFRKATDLYFARYDGQAVTTEEFIKSIEEASGRDLTQFRRWYWQAGTPHILIEDYYNPELQTYTLRIKQSCPETADHSPKAPFLIPIAMALLDEAGREMPLQMSGELHALGKTRVLELSQVEQTFELVNVSEWPTPSWLREFSAPVKLEYAYTDSQLAHLLLHDKDPFARWEAGQEWASRLLLRGVMAHKAGIAWEHPSTLVSSFQRLLTQELHHVDMNLLAKLLVLPQEEYLLQQIAQPCVDAIRATRQWFKRHLAEQLEALWLENYHAIQPARPYQYNAEEMGKRSVRNVCLDYLLMLEKPEYLALATQQWQNADNMTDAFGALVALNQHAGSAREQAMQAFYEHWQHESLVMDKWFMLQASAVFPETLIRVQALLADPAFDANNPNKIRALIGSFARNLTCFHHRTGSGYRFVVDQVWEIDERNPQIAARLLDPLTDWKRFDEQRQQLMCAELQRLAAKPNLSKDAYEIVMKSLKHDRK